MFRRYLFLFIVSTSSLLLSAQQAPSTSAPFRAADAAASPRIARLRGDIQKSGARVVEQFWEEIREKGAPLIEAIRGDELHSLVTFVWQGSAAAENVVIADGVAAAGGVDPRDSMMTRIAATDVWYRTYEVRNDARFTYALSENDPLTSFIDPSRKSNSKPDPLNPNRFLTGQTYVELRDAPRQPWITRRSEMLGRVENIALNNRNLWVYTPLGFQSTAGPYPLVVALGGAAYVNWVPTPVILDSLIAEKRIPPVVAVIAGYSNAEATCSPAFADFLAKELVPWMRTTYRATDSPAQTIIGGASLGGLASTFAAVSHPNVFGKVLSQSGSYWWKPVSDAEGEWLTRRIAATSKLPVEFFLEVGRMEVPDQLDTNRRLRDTLSGKGYAVEYREFNGNHSYINWRGSFADGLIALLGK